MNSDGSWRPWRGFVVGPASCQVCGAFVWFGRSRTRVNGEAVLGEVRVWREWGRYAIHRCNPTVIGAQS